MLVHYREYIVLQTLGPHRSFKTNNNHDPQNRYWIFTRGKSPPDICAIARSMLSLDLKSVSKQSVRGGWGPHSCLDRSHVVQREICMCARVRGRADSPRRAGQTAACFGYNTWLRSGQAAPFLCPAHLPDLGPTSASLDNWTASLNLNWNTRADRHFVPRSF